MGLGLGIIGIVGMGIVLGFMVVQAKLAARKWRHVIAEGDVGALRELLDQTFEEWQRARPPRGTPPADWAALHSASIVAADSTRVRVALIADADVRMVAGQRVESGTAVEVARRTTVRMIERLMYEVPYVHFEQVQVDVHSPYREADGETQTACILSTHGSRDEVATADWDHGTIEEILEGWHVTQAASGESLDPEVGAVIAVDEVALTDWPRPARDSSELNDRPNEELDTNRADDSTNG